MVKEKGYSVFGSGSPVVLLHSSMSSKSQWNTLITQLKDNHKIIAADLIGYGDLDYPDNEESFSLLHEVAWVKSLLEKETTPHETVHLVGHSYGAAVALRLTYEMPDKINALTLYEPVAFHLLQKDEPAHIEILRIVSGLKNTLHDAGEKQAAELFIDYWSGTGFFKRLPQRTQTGFAREIKKVLLDFKALTEEEKTLEDYSGITTPCCFIAGTKSPLSTNRISELIVQTLPSLEYYQVEGGHMAPITHPELVNPIIISSIKNTRD